MRVMSFQLEWFVSGGAPTISCCDQPRSREKIGPRAGASTEKTWRSNHQYAQEPCHPQPASRSTQQQLVAHSTRVTSSAMKFHYAGGCFSRDSSISPN